MYRRRFLKGGLAAFVAGLIPLPIIEQAIQKHDAKITIKYPPLRFRESGGGDTIIVSLRDTPTVSLSLDGGEDIILDRLFISASIED